MIIPENAQKYIDLQRTGYKKNPQNYVAQIKKEFDELKSYLPGDCDSILDIGCGLSIIDIFIKEFYGKDIKINLADKDKIDKDIHYGYKANGSFYNSFLVTEEIFKKNNVTNYKFLSAETGKDIPYIGNQDIIISLLSCGYHYPIDFYLDKMNEILSTNGVIIVDIREQTYHVISKKIKKIFPIIQVIRHENKAYRICARRGPVKKKRVIGDKKKKREIPSNIIYRWVAVLKRIPENVKMIGAEIGVLTGDTAMRILRERPLVTHIMVDPWIVQPSDSSFVKSGDNCSKKPQNYHDTAYKLTVERTKFAGKRAIIKKMYSHEAVKDIDDKSLDYVFVDGDHSYTGCLNDMKLWIPKIKPGGWIGGHDYGNPRIPGVKQAVDEYFDSKSIEIDHEDTWFVRVM